MPNPYHEPAGSSKGGQFTNAQLGTIERSARKAAGLTSKIVDLVSDEQAIEVYKRIGGEENIKAGTTLLGFYDEKTDTIYMNGSLSRESSGPKFHSEIVDNSYPGVLAHEQGHAFYRTQLNEGQRRAFEQAYEMSKPRYWMNVISGKANSASEVFAELHSAYIMGHPLPKVLVKTKEFRKALDLFDSYVKK